MKTLQKAIMVLFLASLLPLQASAQNFTSRLHQGLSGDEVKVLQALLAADQDIYPEGIISGYYGQLTMKAVKRFQKKYQLEQVGYLGPKTLKKLNELLSNSPLEVRTIQTTATSSTSGIVITTTKVVCARVPPGHLIAPGWLKKNNGVVPIVPECETLPPGIERHFTGSTTTPPVNHEEDKTVPTISSLNVSSVGTSFATVSWKTNEFATTKVYFGTTSPVTVASSTLIYTGGLALTHNVSLTSLATGTMYYFIAVSSDSSGNTATSSQGTFTTSVPVTYDTTAPTILFLTASTATTSATITWGTNEPATTKVYFGTTSPITLASSTFQQVEGFDTLHTVTLTGLTTGTTYYLLVASTDASGNTATSSQLSVTTTIPVAPDTTAPVLSNIVLYTSSNTATVIWTTSEPATGTLYYSTSSPLVLASSSSILANALTTNQVVTIPNLTASTTYFYMIEAKDLANNVGTSTQASFTTGH